MTTLAKDCLQLFYTQKPKPNRILFPFKAKEMQKAAMLHLFS